MISPQGVTPPGSAIRVRNELLLALATAAIEYAEQTSGGGADPLMAGARLRLAARAYAQAERAVRGP